MVAATLTLVVTSCVLDVVDVADSVSVDDWASLADDVCEFWGSVVGEGSVATDSDTVPVVDVVTANPALVETASTLDVTAVSVEVSGDECITLLDGVSEVCGGSGGEGEVDAVPSGEGVTVSVEDVPSGNRLLRSLRAVTSCDVEETDG